MLTSAGANAVRWRFGRCCLCRPVRGLLWVAAAFLIYRPAGYQRSGLDSGAGSGGPDGVGAGPRLDADPTSSGFARSRRSSWRRSSEPWGRCRSGSCSRRWFSRCGRPRIAHLYRGRLPGGVGGRRQRSARDGLAVLARAGRRSRGSPARCQRTRAKRPFRSPFEAQVSYEWGCHGLMLNGFVGVMLFLIWGVLLLRQGHGTPDMARDDLHDSAYRRRGDHRRDGNRVRPVSAILEPYARACDGTRSSPPGR